MGTNVGEVCTIDLQLYETINTLSGPEPIFFLVYTGTYMSKMNRLDPAHE